MHRTVFPAHGHLLPFVICAQVFFELFFGFKHLEVEPPLRSFIRSSFIICDWHHFIIAQLAPLSSSPLLLNNVTCAMAGMVPPGGENVRSSGT